MDDEVIIILTAYDIMDIVSELKALGSIDPDGNVSDDGAEVIMTEGGFMVMVQEH